MAKKAVGDGAQFLLHPLRIGAEGFAGAVAAGGQQRFAQLPQQQGVQGAGRQHHPQPGVVRGNTQGDARGVARGNRAGGAGFGVRPDKLRRPPAQQHDRGGRGGEQPFLGGAQQAVAPHPGKIGRQQCKGLLGSPLAPPQLGHGRLRTGQAEQLEAPDALQGHDPPGPQGCGRCGQAGAERAAGARWIPEAGAAGGEPAQPRPAGGAAAGLGVEAAVAGVGVFRGAGGAEAKGGQRGVASLEGQGPQDAEAGPAVGAAGEGVAAAAAGGIGELRQAGGAGGQIGQLEGGGGGRGATGGALGSRGEDAEAGAGLGGQPLLLEPIEAAVGRPLAGQARQEGLKRGGWTLQLQADASGGVLHPARQLQGRRQAVHEGTKAHPLHQPLDVEPQPPVPGGAHAGRGWRWWLNQCSRASTPSPVRADTSKIRA